MLSIIIPTKNREAILKQTLQKALEATDGLDINIIVINDGDELKNKIESPKIQYHKNPKHGVSSARNFGASLTKPDWLLFLDDDMWISKQTIDAFYFIINQDDGNTVYCLNWEYPENLNVKLEKEKIGRYILNASYNTMKGRISKNLVWNKTFEKINGIGSGSLLLSVRNFHKIGQYNEAIAFQGEDIDLSNNLVKNEIKILSYVPITCFHNQQDRLDLNGFLEREFRGYKSQRLAEEQGLIITSDCNTIKDRIYKLLTPFESVFIYLFNIMPNNKYFNVISFRLIGMLSSIQKIKAHKN